MLIDVSCCVCVLTHFVVNVRGNTCRFTYIIRYIIVRVPTVKNV